MDSDPFRRASSFILAGLLLIGAGLAFPFSSASEDVSVTNPTDRGADGLWEILRTAAARAGSPEPRIWQGDLDDLGAVDRRASLLVLGPSTRFTASEAAAIASMLDSGSIVLVADDTGLANSLLERLPTQTRILAGELIDLAYSRQPQFPVLYSIFPHGLTLGVDSLIANAAATVRRGANATTLVASSDSSWLDINDDGLPNEGDRRGPHPVLTTESIGRGELIVLSDPSILSNEMLPAASNRFFAENLARYLTVGGSQVHVDETHREHRPFALITGALPAASDPVRYGFLAFVAIAIAGTWAGRIGAKRFVAWRENRRKEDPDVVETVLTRNPQWSERDLQRLARHLLTGTRSDDRG